MYDGVERLCEGREKNGARAILDPLYESVACVLSRTKRTSRRRETCTGLNWKNSLTPREKPNAKGPRGKRERRRKADKRGERT